MKQVIDRLNQTRSYNLADVRLIINIFKTMKNMNREATLEKEKEWYGKNGRIDACFQLICSIIYGWDLEDRF